MNFVAGRAAEELKPDLLNEYHAFIHHVTFSSQGDLMEVVPTLEAHGGEIRRITLKLKE